MDPTDLILELVRAVGYGTIGVVIGLAFTWRRATVHGVEVRVPTARPDKPVWKRIIGALLVLVAVLSMTQSTIFTARQSACNEEFRRVIQERGDAATEQAEIWSQLERELATIGPAPTLELQQQIVEARKRYVVRYEALTEERKNNPYPDPRC
ncbi:hypothetical protein SEA_PHORBESPHLOWER_23 [Gordonia phage PhorbesPhlower]|nr:hypothetical protein SEA_PHORBESPHLOWER_23 [Gordonia phage PhorbesPhlower]UUG69884.1 hypothetical protein SEA_MORKIE_23 [Gordonia phage Morkie]